MEEGELPPKMEIVGTQSLRYYKPYVWNGDNTNYQIYPNQTCSKLVNDFKKSEIFKLSKIVKHIQIY